MSYTVIGSNKKRNFLLLQACDSPSFYMDDGSSHKFN